MLRLRFENWQSNNKGVYEKKSLGANDAFKRYFCSTNDYPLALTAKSNQVNDILKIALLCLDDFNLVDIKKRFSG